MSERAKDPWHGVVKVALLDTRTGSVAIDEQATLYNYCMGNWSCDCNRSIPFGMRPSMRGTCIGARRFLVVRCDERGDITLREMNADYPEKLLAEFLPKEE